MLYVTLICTDEACAREYETCTTAGTLADPLADLEARLCEDCDCTLQVISISAVPRRSSVTRLPRRSEPGEGRRAA